MDSVLPHNILSALRDQTKVYGNMIHMPERLSVVLDGHKRSVNAVQWSKSHGEWLNPAKVLILNFVSYLVLFYMVIFIKIGMCFSMDASWI